MRTFGGHAGRTRVTWCLLLLLAVAVVLAFAQSRYAMLREVSVRGTSRLDPGQVAEFSGLRPGQSVFSLRPARVAARLRSLPWVKEAGIRWAWPGRAVIWVSERTPVALVPHHDRFLVVDAEGRVLTTTEEASPWGLPLVTGPVPAEPMAGQFLTDQGILAALACVEAFPQSGRERVAEVHASEKGELVVYDLDGVPALLGLPDAYLPEKVRVLVAIWDDLRRQGGRAEYVDIRDHSRAIVKPAQGG
ncbi:MAG: FtsQ-type POTRA domain-containing protein [Bacillota bacterium]